MKIMATFLLGIILTLLALFFNTASAPKYSVLLAISITLSVLGLICLGVFWKLREGAVKFWALVPFIIGLYCLIDSLMRLLIQRRLLD